MRRARALALAPIFALTSLAAASGGCNSDSNQRADGAISVTGSGGSGGGGGGGGTAMANCGDTSGPVDPTAMIDDMEAPSYNTLMEAGRNGAWWAGGDMMSPGA